MGQGGSIMVKENNIETIFTHNEGTLGIDGNNNLYWNGKKIVTQGKVTLGWWVNTSIILASTSTFAMAIFAALNFFK